MPRRFFSLLPITVVILSSLVSCSTGRKQVGSDWTEMMFFKNAQEAMDENRYKTAVYYYEVFLVRYPESHQRTIAAEYELAFIQYKQGNLKEAEAAFQTIIEKYDTGPYAMLYHPRFRYLSEIGLESIEKHRAVTNRLFWRKREKDWALDHGGSLLDDGTENPA